MLINKELANNCNIFPRSGNPLYLRTLVSLGFHSIFIYIKNNVRIKCVGAPIWRYSDKEFIEQHFICVTFDNCQSFNFDCCSISEIKEVLYLVKVLDIDTLPLQFKHIFFSDVGK